MSASPRLSRIPPIRTSARCGCSGGARRSQGSRRTFLPSRYSPISRRLWPRRGWKGRGGGQWPKAGTPCCRRRSATPNSIALPRSEVRDCSVFQRRFLVNPIATGSIARAKFGRWPIWRPGQAIKRFPKKHVRWRAINLRLRLNDGGLRRFGLWARWLPWRAAMSDDRSPDIGKRRRSASREWSGTGSAAGSRLGDWPSPNSFGQSQAADALADLREHRFEMGAVVREEMTAACCAGRDLGLVPMGYFANLNARERGGSTWGAIWPVWLRRCC